MYICERITPTTPVCGERQNLCVCEGGGRGDRPTTLHVIRAYNQNLWFFQASYLTQNSGRKFSYMSCVSRDVQIHTHKLVFYNRIKTVHKPPQCRFLIFARSSLEWALVQYWALLCRISSNILGKKYEMKRELAFWHRALEWQVSKLQVGVFFSLCPAFVRASAQTLQRPPSNYMVLRRATWRRFHVIFHVIIFEATRT